VHNRSVSNKCYEGEVGDAPDELGPGTVPVTGFVGAETAGEAPGAGEVGAGCFAVTPLSWHAASERNAMAGAAIQR
jgi:hypothetical protein